MRKVSLQNRGWGRFWPMILLLAAAVILPTVCLLWYMTQAVENVRLAARQKLVGIYRENLDEAVTKIDGLWQGRAERITKLASEDAMRNFMTFAIEYGEGKESAGVLITYDNNGRLLYPIMTEQTEPNLPEEFQKAWQLEFVKKDFQQASKTYMHITESATDNYIWRKAKLGYARCEIGRGRPSVAKNFYREAAYERVDSNMSPSSISLAAQARVMLGESELGRLFAMATQYEPELSGRRFLPMDSATRVFVLRKAIELAEEYPNSKIYENNNTDEGREIGIARGLLRAERMAEAVIERYPDASGFGDWVNGSVHRLDVGDEVAAFYVKSAERSFLLLRSDEDVKKDLSILETTFADSDIGYRISNDSAVLLSRGEPGEDKPFLTVEGDKSFSGWKIKLFSSNSDIFSDFAGRQVTVYVWGGVLVIVLMLLAGGAAVQMVGRQIKLNRLKNDFIATVSHELKTPLASMRVLVDTLLEGNYKDQQQATEYLQLVSKENKRLSGLIDNFLTFSRMERNKQAFEILETRPAAIAGAAADAVQTKFGQGRCDFDVSIDKGLPMVPADRDAMVTAIVNLLDNAYKYSYDDKHIRLKVYAEVGFVCFSIVDSGIGMSRRATRKVFERFYQVDRHLARRAQGCGLGLSIVKFIVDAHGGSITIDSKQGKGSVFTIKLPALDVDNGKGSDN